MQKEEISKIDGMNAMQYLRNDIKKCIQDGKQQYLFNSEQELSEFIAKYVKGPASEGAIANNAPPLSSLYFPIVQSLRIYGRFNIPENIVLADLPGLNDANAYREKATKDYISKCSHIFVVFNYANSALTKLSTIQMIEENLQNRPVHEISIIITKLDIQSGGFSRDNRDKTGNDCKHIFDL
jgi:hypothetical protein